MFRFIGRRLLVAIPTLFLVVTLAFFMMRAAPGSPFDTDRRLSPEIEKNVLAKYGMNKPVAAQYVDYLASVARGVRVNGLITLVALSVLPARSVTPPLTTIW